MTALACLALLAPASLPAHAQGNWTVTDQSGNPLISSADGFDLKGSPTGSIALGGAYPDVLAAAQNPNASTNSDAFTPNLSSYQGWLFSGNAPGPYQVYDPFHIWTEAAASNTVGYRWSSGRAFRLGPPSNKDVNGSITAATGGTLWAIWQWSDPYASYPGYYTSHGQTPPQPPDHITVLLTSRVGASAAVTPYGSPLYVNVAGLSATATASDNLNETATASAGENASTDGVGLVVGKRLLRVPVNATGRAEVSLGGTTTATATNTVPYGTIGNYPGSPYGGYPMVTNGPLGANASAYISGTAARDYREIVLHRDGAKLDFIGNDGKRHGEWMDQNGLMHGETTFSYWTDAPPHQKVLYNTQVVRPTFSGAWSQKPDGTLNIAWAWDLQSHAPRVWNVAEYDMIVGNIYYVNGVAAGSADPPFAYDISYTATDRSDGVTVVAAYALSVHDQWDNLRLDPVHPFDVIDSDAKVKYGSVDYPAQENRSTAQSMPVGPLTVSSTATASLSSQLNGTFKLSDFFTLGGNFQSSFSLAMQAGQSVTGPPIPPLHYVQLYFHIHYHKNHWLTDHYTPAGFDQTYTETIDGDEKYISLHWGHAEDLGNAGGPSGS